MEKRKGNNLISSKVPTEIMYWKQKTGYSWGSIIGAGYRSLKGESKERIAKLENNMIKLQERYTKISQRNYAIEEELKKIKNIKND